eukprot:TRINITY_DN940_c0_g1_i3.p1 TRINITY_DN940_c0_g1~~TRINITY_DN940_c0_g1_i3.p1  ORF type:complete len:411 (+),score=67.61 TRINITY_DN940_c0_g1_i3:486-1718(+)
MEHCLQFTIFQCPHLLQIRGSSAASPNVPSENASPLIMSPLDSDGADSVSRGSFSGTPTVGPVEKPNYCTSPVWVLGVALLIGGAIGDFLALGFAAQSTVAPLGSLTLVVNMFMARWMHGERITPIGVIATICIVAGSFLTIAFANHSTFQYSIDEIFDLYITTRFIVYASIMVSWIGGMWYCVRRWDKDPHIKKSPLFPVYKLFFAALNGTIGGHNVLFAKFTVEIFAMGKVQAFTHGLFYFTFACMIGTVLIQVKWLNEGLSRFDAIFMVPVSTAFWVFFSVFSGIITFAEYTVMTWFEIIYFCIGIMLILIGVLVFTRTKTTTSSRRSVDGGQVGGKSNRRISKKIQPTVRSPLTQGVVGDEESPPSSSFALGQPARSGKRDLESNEHHRMNQRVSPRSYQTISPEE